MLSDDELDTAVLPLRLARSAGKPTHKMPNRHPHHPASPPKTSDVEYTEDDLTEDAVYSGDELPEDPPVDGNDTEDNGDEDKPSRKHKRSGWKKEKPRKKLCDYETDTEKFVAFLVILHAYRQLINFQT